MRDDYHPARFTIILIVVLVVAFLIQSLLLFYGHFDSFHWLGLSVSGLRHGRVWQLLTFQFLHAAPMPWHLLFNCIGLYVFGRSVEETIGSRRFLLVYFLSGIAGGLLQAATTVILPNHRDVAVVGASAGICGLIAIFCSFYPMRELRVWLYIFPVNVRARYFLWFVGGLSVFGTFIPFEQVAHGAHLGGILFGLAYVYWFHDSTVLASCWSKLRGPRQPRPILKVRFPKAITSGSDPHRDEFGSPDFMSREVDPILEKISAHGIHSLTERERRILEAARARIDKP